MKDTKNRKNSDFGKNFAMSKKSSTFAPDFDKNEDKTLSVVTELTKKWQQCQTILRDNLTESAFQMWFAPVVPVSFDNNVLILQVKSQFVVEYIEDNYIPILSTTIRRVFGPQTRLEYRVLMDSVSGAASTIPSPGSNTEIPAQPRIQMPKETHEAFDTQLNPSYTFENFIAGEPNKLARVAGLTIAKKPGYNAFNPIFIYGGSGVGKTHLANAIGNMVCQLDPSKKVLYVSANTFKLQYMAATQENRVPDFLNFYQQVDVLIVDDIQYFTSKGTQDTFFHIFNYLQQSHKQLILTSDRSPLQLKDIEDRLLTRFKWGLSTEILHPDFQLRKDILCYKLHRDGITLDENIIDFIANNVRDSIRDLEGVLASLMAYSTLTDRDIDMALAEQVVGRIVDIKPASVSVNDVLNEVASFYNIEAKTITSEARSKEVMQARHAAMFLSKELTDNSLSEIGAAIGGRSHATVLHSIKLMRDQLDIDPVLRHRISQMTAALRR